MSNSALRASKYAIRVSTPRGLWREVLYASDSWPAGRSDALTRAKKAFAENASLSKDSPEARVALRRGEWMVSQMHELARFHRYRAMKKRYNDADSQVQTPSKAELDDLQHQLGKGEPHAS